jgi:hypothetical protein
MLVACGKDYFLAGRSLPPSGILNRVMFAEQNPNALPFVDAYYDVRHNASKTVGQFEISGFSGKLPVTIQNMPVEQVGAVYNAGSGNLALVNYAKEQLTTAISIPGGYSDSIFITRNLDYVFAANDANHVVSVVDRLAGKSYILNLPGVYGISVNPGGTIALAFVKNSDQGPDQSTELGTPNGEFSVYSIVKLTQAQSQAAANNPHFTYTDANGHTNTAEDCEPQNLPAYCIFPVSTGPNAQFNHPIKAVFSSDGSTAYVLDCGPECGGTEAGLTAIPLTVSTLNPGGIGPSGINLVASSFTPISHGVTDALFNGNTMYIAGQQCVDPSTGDPLTGVPCSGLFTGYLTTFDTTTGKTQGAAIPISDGYHDKMVFGDDNTLWIGSNLCNGGLRYEQAQAGKNENYGCLTMYNTQSNTATIDSYKGDATGIASVGGLHKVYSAEGGQVYIYSTKDMSQLDNSNVTVQGTVTDVAYMDSGTDSDNTYY